MQYIKKVKDLPVVPYFAILIERAECVSDGYDGTNTSDVWDVCTFSSREEWEKEIKKMTLATGYNKQVFQAVEIKPATVNVEVKVSSGQDLF